MYEWHGWATLRKTPAVDYYEDLDQETPSPPPVNGYTFTGSPWRRKPSGQQPQPQDGTAGSGDRGCRAVSEDQVVEDDEPDDERDAVSGKVEPLHIGAKLDAV